MRSKVFEIRDSGTFIVVAATKMSSREAENAREVWLLDRADCGMHVVMTELIRRANGTLPSETYSEVWREKQPHIRTMYLAHKYIEENWDDLVSGDVIDLEFLVLGTRTESKLTEQTEDFIWNGRDYDYRYDPNSDEKRPVDIDAERQKKVGA